MLDEGDTVTQEIETEHFGEGHIDTITETTVTVEHKTTDDLLHKDTGVVATRYEGDMDQDWGGLGPASMPNCNNYFGTGKCGKGTSNSLTTFDQYVDISDFHISDGGALDWELQMHHSQANTTGYFQTKGYNDNVLQWDTGQITLENNQTPTTYSGTYDFAGDLDKVFIRIGGAKNYYFDNVAYTVNYNHITTSVETWIEIVQPGLMEDQITIELIEQYEVATPEEQYQMDEMMEEFDMVMTFDMPTMDYSMEDMEVDIPIELDNINTMMEDYNEGTISYEDVMVDVQEMVEEIQDIGVEVEVSMPSMEEVEEPILETTMEEPIEMEVVEETTTEPVEVVEETKEEPTEEIADVSEDNNMEEIKEEAKEESESQEKEVANKDMESEEVDQEEPKKLEVTKQQQKKQDKANQILATIQSQYDPVAQLTTIALVTALGPDIKQYQQQDIMQQMQWYEAEEIYTDKLMADPLGDYISVRSNLQMERMIQQQYE
jgi:dihydroneopterin aldolase